MSILSIASAPAAAFGFQDVVSKAQALAKRSYAPPAEIPAFLRNLKFEQYQGIRFRPEKSLWRDGDSRFQVMLVSPALYYKHAVKINVADATGVHPLPYRKADFSFANREIAEMIPPDLGYAGFKLTYPLSAPGVQNQFLVFAGASYFRGVGKDNAFGISARGIAVDTGLPSGEEFPSFVEYWLVKPAPGADTMQFYALLEGKSLTGAYHFTVVPGKATALKVKAVLFPRDTIALLGVAPLTSMFYYGENTARPAGEWRPQVHDSDGLLVHDGSTGEWLWRPLINPKYLQTYYFQTHNVRGFGLLQRQTDFRDYQDLGARYEKRPSAWITPDGDWGKGQVVLVELPAPNETEDNIVAFWTPERKPKPGKRVSLSYTLSFGDYEQVAQPTGISRAVFVGDGAIIGGGTQPGSYRIIVDFSGGPLARLPPDTPVRSEVTALEGGSVIEHFVEYAEPLHRWRLSMLVKPASGKPLSVRAFLREGQQALTETWTYELPVAEQFRSGLFGASQADPGRSTAGAGNADAYARD